MEKTKNRAFINFFKNMGATLGKLVTDGEVDNSVELTGELKEDPIVALENFQNSHKDSSTRQAPTRTTPNRAKAPQVQQTRTTRTTRTNSDVEHEI